MRTAPFLSVVFPVFNESEVIDISFKAFKETLDKFRFAYEVVVDDDCPTDDSISKLENWADLWPELKVLSFISNKGHMANITAGLIAAIPVIVANLKGSVVKEVTPSIPRLRSRPSENLLSSLSLAGRSKSITTSRNPSQAKRPLTNL